MPINIYSLSSLYKRLQIGTTTLKNIFLPWSFNLPYFSVIYTFHNLKEQHLI